MYFSGLFQCEQASTPYDCISPTQICDGARNCRDGSDEIACESYTCLEGQFKCKHPPKCIPDAQRCNGQFECDDHSDEKGSECRKYDGHNVYLIYFHVDIKLYNFQLKRCVRRISLCATISDVFLTSGTVITTMTVETNQTSQLTVSISNVAMDTSNVTHLGGVYLTPGAVMVITTAVLMTILMNHLSAVSKKNARLVEWYIITVLNPCDFVFR